MKKIGLYWFANDLRVEDNPTLINAASAVDKLICIFCIDPSARLPGLLAPSKLSPKRQQFLFESLVDLDETLKSQGQQLLVLFKSPLDAVAELITKHNVSHIFRSHNSGEYERKVWETLCKRYSMIEFTQTNSNTLFDSSELPFDLDSPSTNLPDSFSKYSFSKFRRSVEKLPIKASVGKPSTLPPNCLDAADDWQALWRKYFPDSLSTSNPLFTGGLNAGQKHCQSYFNTDNASSYKETRNGLDGMDYSTKFSPWLANGCISPRQIINRLRRYESENGANDSTYWIYFELLWREYFQWYAKCHGAKLFRFSGIKLRNPTTSFYPERFQKWCKGNTPYPIVNACMKQLNTTGYMSNRGRQLVASCFVHELNLDWRYGAAYMEQQLVDYDVASNWGNWQYLAGVGPDPRGHRQFDLNKQSRIYDPEGLFIKFWAGDQPLGDLDSRDAVDWPI